ncbi:flagellar assembly protein FlbE [Brevundimonas naejangsanensis]|uniref:Flagellar assembly protein FlbE n=1 Tax=Brevundimonas naejangsanensis TaxID=588932 RepID=A0A494RHL9_9CAUL|nr:flagellar assembly protein FlbE [Brevundimonas naejangsanensis]AYG94000.1 flagellar assembly protein FlbE [Brevundimonas naejangsanensis]
MTAIPANARPFVFDTEFGADGAVVRPSTWQPVKRSYAPAEVDALVAQARLEARQQALAEVEALRADALSILAQTTSQAATLLRNVAEAHRRESADLALAAARVVASAAFDRFPRRPLEAALEALGQEMDATPRLVVRASGLDDEGRAQVEALCAQAGFSGLVVFRDEPHLPAAAFALEWADGRAEFDPAEAEGRVAAALNAALAAEAGHADPPVDAAHDRRGF